MKQTVLFTLIMVFFFFLYSEEKSETPGNVPGGEIKFVVDPDQFSEGYIERQTLYYEEVVKEYLSEIQSLLRANIEEKRREIEKRYEPVIQRELEKEAQSRHDAIVLFEEFIKKHPDNEEHTPGAMYRLAELYYERSVIAQEKRMEKYEDDLIAFEKKETKKEPGMPVVDFGPTISLYRKILNKFEDFKYMGAVYYMLGYCLAESGNEEEAVAVWLQLLDEKIDTPYLAELYLRIGDYYFNNNELPEAARYFEEGVKFKDSDFFDKILYKLAWTYYRQNFFEQAVASFTELIMFADEMREQGIDRGQDLRKEAVQYISISFADEEWGSIDKAVTYFEEEIDGKLFEREVFEQLGKYYSENSNFSEAEKAYRFILKRHPFYENAPRIHYSMIQLFNQARDFDKASKETAIFAKLYDSDSEWVRINRGNATVVREAAEWARGALLSTASFHHRQAQALKERGEIDDAVAEYRLAAIAYGEYLIKFPYTSESYDITYSFADTLFQSGDIEMAVVVYERIRDDKNQDRLRDDAAFQTFVCYNMIWEKSEERNISGEEKRGKPFSLLEQKLIESSDIYLELAKEVEDKPAIAYTVGRIYFDHGHFEEAEKRYLSIISEFPQHQAAIFAARDIIAAYTEKEDWISVARWSKLLTERLSPSESEGKEVMQEFTTYRAGALFMYAQKLEEEKQYREAAAEYLRLVEENPYNENADKALSNAAINYQRALMFESALRLHERIYKEYPYSSLAPQSLYLVAFNAERSYDFEKAVDAYKLLYEKYPTYDRIKEAVYNAGFLLERLKRYREASAYYRLFYTIERDKVEGKDALYLAAYMFWKSEDWRAAIKSFQDFINTFGNDPEVYHLVMRAYYNIAKIYEEKINNWKRATETYRQIVDYYNERSVESEEAILYVAESMFKLLEDEYNAYLKIRIGGRDEKALEESFRKKVESLKVLEDKYREVLKYPAYEWVLASLYRMGYLLQSFSDALFNADIPKGLSYEEEEIYVEMLRKQAEPLEERAVALYSSGLERAKELRVFNKWTQLMTERLSVIRAAEYSFGKTPQYAFDNILESGFPVSLSLDKIEKKKYQQAGLDAKTENKEESSSKEESK
jgi:cellulose synthase operon protein C